MTEKELLEKCVSGDNASWKLFVETYAPLIKTAVSRALPAKRSPGEFQDIYQEVLEELSKDNFSALRSFKGRCKLTTWLWTVARRKTRRYLEKLDDFEFIETDAVKNLQSADNPVKDLEARELNRIVGECIAELDEKDREIIDSYYVSGCSYAEISKIKGIPVPNVSTVIFRARQKLAEKLEKRLK
jgi:RNA polymerase sigma factor (sigma-70 family)